MVVTPPEITVIQAALATVNGWGLGNLKSGLLISHFSYLTSSERSVSSGRESGNGPGLVRGYADGVILNNGTNVTPTVTAANNRKNYGPKVRSFLWH